MGHDWHPECFNCDKCRVPLSPDNFLEKNGRPYCPNCFDKLFLPKCFACSKPIQGTVGFLIFQIDISNDYCLLFNSHYEQWDMIGIRNVSIAINAVCHYHRITFWKRMAVHIVQIVSINFSCQNVMDVRNQLKEL